MRFDSVLFCFVLFWCLQIFSVDEEDEPVAPTAAPTRFSSLRHIVPPSAMKSSAPFVAAAAAREKEKDKPREKAEAGGTHPPGYNKGGSSSSGGGALNVHSHSHSPSSHGTPSFCVRCFRVRRSFDRSHRVRFTILMS